MRRWKCRALALTVLISFSVFPVYAQDPDEIADTFATVEDLGNGLYRVGQIDVDLNQQLFTVPGIVGWDDEPLRSLAVTSAGFKGSESLIELDANAYEIQAACELLGISAGSGDLLEITISWEIDGTTTTVDAADFVLHGADGLSHDGWIYTGSTLTIGDELKAHHDGTVIGIVQDPAGLITHAAGLAANEPLAPNLSSLPQANTWVSLTIRR